MTKVFISYSRKDEEFARQLATDLDRFGASIWLDVDDIPPGVNWSSAVQQGLDTCDTLLLIISPDSMDSGNVTDEWQYFRDEHKPIIPIIYRITPTIHFQLRRIQYVDFMMQDYEIALGQLRERMFGEEAQQGGQQLRKAVPGVITLGSARHLDTRLELAGHRDSVKDIALNPDGTLAATCSEDKTVRLWYTTGRKRIKAMIGHEKPVNTVAFSASGLFLASGSDDKTIRLWHVQKRFCITALVGHAGPVTGVVYSPAESILASASEDGTVRLWNAKERQPLNVLGAHDGPASDVAFSPDGRLVASAGLDHTVRLWDAANRAERRELAVIPASDGVRQVVFSPNGALVAAALEGNGMILVSVAKKEILASIFYADYNTNCVRGLAFTPDGTLLAMASLDGAIRLWNVDQLAAGKKGRALRSLRGHDGGITSLAFSMDGALMATASHDGTARLWAVKQPKRGTRSRPAKRSRPDTDQDGS
jgi:WD40 repeat protein